MRNRGIDRDGRNERERGREGGRKVIKACTSNMHLLLFVSFFSFVCLKLAGY
jgi:hypothetical protein